MCYLFGKIAILEYYCIPPRTGITVQFIPASSIIRLLQGGKLGFQIHQNNNELDRDTKWFITDLSVRVNVQAEHMSQGKNKNLKA